MIPGFSNHELSQILNEQLSPSTPITDPNHLLGRERKLIEIERAFTAKGRHVFIYGDRGVGKTSLALSAATKHHPASSDPISVSCDNRSTFNSLIEDAYKAYASTHIQGKALDYFKFKPPFLELGKDFSADHIDLSSIHSVNDAARVFDFVGKSRAIPFVFVFDEFEHLQHKDSRELMASLVKKISDSDINVRFIFCGIGKSVEDLLGSHLSSGRYIAPIELERLGEEALWSIVSNVCDAVKIKIDRETQIRIGRLSDGFPYFVHLVCEHMLWATFDTEKIESHIRLPHFDRGVTEAVNHSFVSLKHAYDGATKKYNDDYQEVLWALADRPTLSRQTNEIYEKSYVPIMRIRNAKLEDNDKKEALSIGKFRARLNNLKTERHGKIIHGTGAGWYEFSENMIRGYVRLRAKNSGVDLGIDHHYDYSKIDALKQ